MVTKIRPEISMKNKYWINRHRYYELKHFCLQYPEWRKTYAALNELSVSTSILEDMLSNSGPSDLTAKYALKRAYYSEKIRMIEQTAMDADGELYIYILRGVTEGLSYTNLKTKLNIPCSRDTYYDRYRKFFWLLNETRN